MIETISPNDIMFGGTRESYLENAKSALLAIDKALFCADVKAESVRRVLDFGSGYGRVLRALKDRFPEASLTAVDVIPAAIQFCHETFGAEPILGHEDLSQIVYPEKFDVIWVGSVFTHMSMERFYALFDHLTDALAPGGVLVFTTHGRIALWVSETYRLKKSTVTEDEFYGMKEEFYEKGFGYVPYRDTHMAHLIDKQGANLSKGGYGVSCCTAGWVSDLVTSREGLYLLSGLEGGWGYNHDTVSVLKPKKPRILRRGRPV